MKRADVGEGSSTSSATYEGSALEVQTPDAVTGDYSVLGQGDSYTISGRADSARAGQDFLNNYGRVNDTQGKHFLIVVQRVRFC